MGGEGASFKHETCMEGKQMHKEHWLKKSEGKIALKTTRHR
jgi:hypothetical protein